MNKLKKCLNVLLQVLLAVCLFVFFASSAVFLTLACKPLYYLDMELLDIEEYSGFDNAEIKENYDALIDYNLPLTDGELIFPSENMMSETAKIHFEEVKDIFDLFKYMALVSIPLCICGIWYFESKKKKEYLLYTGILTLFLPTVLGAFIALNWEKVFLTFHEIAFDNDYWIFDPYEDQIIRILPSEFFMHCAVMIVSIVFIGGGICALLYFWRCRSYFFDKIKVLFQKKEKLENKKDS